MTSRLGRTDLCQILSTIEENFSKINFQDLLENAKSDNWKSFYKCYYNYLPTLFGQGLKGVWIL